MNTDCPHLLRKYEEWMLSETSAYLAAIVANRGIVEICSRFTGGGGDEMCVF